ncbi:MAG TPA: hypothetical protein PLI57_05270 [Spirochaetota bacterium]|nr:hypothetical protein [Spirochaetota bacterium]
MCQFIRTVSTQRICVKIRIKYSVAYASIYFPTTKNTDGALLQIYYYSTIINPNKI